MFVMLSLNGGGAYLLLCELQKVGRVFDEPILVRDSGTYKKELSCFVVL